MTFNPAAFFVRRWQFTLVAFMLLALLGLNAFSSIPRAEDPHFPVPFMIVRAVMPGASPTEMEQLVAKPIEDAVNGLDDVKKVQSTSVDSVAIIRVEFQWKGDPERRYDQVVREVNALRGALPAGITRLEVQRGRTTEVAVFQVALTSDILPDRRLEKVAHKLRDQLNRIPGIRQSTYWGAPQTEARVALDIAKLSQLKLSVFAVADALRAAGVETPVGTIHAGDRRFSVKSGGAFHDLDRIGAIVVASPGGQPFRVRDVAKVSWASGEPSHVTSFNGRRALFVTATQKDDADVTQISKSVSATLDTFEKTLPAGVKLERGFFQADNVKHRLDRLFRDFGLALLLVLVTLLPLGLRAGAVVMVSIPLSLLIGLSLLQAFGFSLNQLSISGFVLSLGLLVDDSIVVVENIARRLRGGEERTAAAINGAGQITFAVIGCTGCLMLAFLPLMALPGGSGAYIKSLPVTVLCTIAASFLVSLTIVPFLASRMLSKHEDPEGNAILQRVDRVIHEGYRPILHRAMEKPWATLGIMLLIVLTTAPIAVAMGTSLFPAAETPQFLIKVENADGVALSETARAVKFVEGRLKQIPEVKWVASNLGRGNPQIFYNQSQHEADPTFGELYVSLKEWKPGPSDKLVDDLRADLRRYPGPKISIVTFENGPPLEAPIAVRFTGENLTVLKSLAARAEQVLRATPGIRDVSNPLRVDRTDLDLGVDEAKAAVLGVPEGAARRVARLALSGDDAARFRDADGDDYPVRVRLPMKERNDLSALSKIYLPTTSGQTTSLASIATPTLTSSPARVERYQRERAVTVTAYVETGFLTSAVTKDVSTRLKQGLSIPPGYGSSLGGQAEAQSESFAGMGAAVITAVLGIMAVLVLEFGRFKTAIVVAGIIPLGVFGAFAALWITGNSLSFTAIIGVIALIGIEIKNSILLVDFTEQMRRDGMGLRDAIERAGEVRFLPVLLTSVTAIFGLLPLAFEHSGLYSPLSIAIIGGLIASTLLSRIATPVMYLLVSRGEAEAQTSGDPTLATGAPA